MQSRIRDLVRALLPIVPLAICNGCGTTGSDAAPVAQTAVPVVSANGAPVIGGDGTKTVQAGTGYSFQPNYSDPDGDALVFTADNLPPWATLDEKTGRVHGTPATSDIGAYEAVSVTVADASHRVSTKAFTITVTGAASGVAKLSWPMPTTKFDGSVLDNLAGYRIIYGRDPEDLDHSVFISDPAAHDYEFATLDSGAWYFSIVGVSDDGLEGPATVPAMKVI
ncbi:MAG TPA: Ig domain-containing protein [Steroidobacteraceae bacterium]|nr:Ig domain-containing protein [Steroidobacteraceae bacterium]